MELSNLKKTDDRKRKSATVILPEKYFEILKREKFNVNKLFNQLLEDFLVEQKLVGKIK